MRSHKVTVAAGRRVSLFGACLLLVTGNQTPQNRPLENQPTSAGSRNPHNTNSLRRLVGLHRVDELASAAQLPGDSRDYQINLLLETVLSSRKARVRSGD